MSRQVKISSIKVGERRREKLGDIKSLAQSINKHGLLNPIVVDEGNNLVAGERRLRACEALDYTKIAVTSLGELSELELREIELDENIKRKDLTAAEKSRTMVRQSEVARQIVAEAKATEHAEGNGSFLSESDKKLGPGRPKGSKSTEPTQQEIADRIGSSQPRLSEAQQHVAALEKYPVLETKDLTQEQAIRAARVLDQAEEEERKKYLKLLEQDDNDTWDFALGREKAWQPSKAEVAEKKFFAINQRLHELAAGIDMAGGLHQIVKRWPEQNQRIFVDQYRALAKRALKQVEEFEQSKGGDLNEF